MIVESKSKITTTPAIINEQKANFDEITIKLCEDDQGLTKGIYR